MSLSATNNNMDSVKLLIEHGCDLDIPSSLTRLTPIMKAYEEKHLEMFKLLKEKGAKIDEELYEECLKNLIEYKENEFKNNEKTINNDENEENSFISSAISTSYCYLSNQTSTFLKSFTKNSNIFNNFEENERNYKKKSSFCIENDRINHENNKEIIKNDEESIRNQCYKCKESVSSGSRTKSGKLLCGSCKKKDPFLSLL